jgi:polysaccharide export outer membrane protein
MRNADIVFIANANSVEVTKFLNYLNTIMGTLNNGVVLSANAVTLKNLLK